MLARKILLLGVIMYTLSKKTREVTATNESF